MKSGGRRSRIWLAAALAAAAVLPASGQSFYQPQAAAPAPKANVLQQITFEQRLNQQVPLDLAFRDEAGRAVTLGQYFGKRPVILTLAYYRCPMLCPQVLHGLAGVLRVVDLQPGRDFEVVTVSFDPQDTPQTAAAEKQSVLARYPRPGAEQGWHFLTGDPAAIAALTQAVGFGYAYIPQSGQFAHASGIMVLTPQGKLAQYFYGVEYPARDLRLALVESSQNRIGTLVDQVLLYCYHYDPNTGRYGVLTMRLLRVGALLTLLLLGTFVGLMLRSEHKRAAMPAAPREGGH
ncbi:MAG TPA: SCO family protein [Terriglobales bacterium]|nr:SCO family protein [Terriglobales bacterium]